MKSKNSRQSLQKPVQNWKIIRRTIVYKNVCLKFLRPLLKKLENANFRKL